MNPSVETPAKLCLWKDSCLIRLEEPLGGRVVGTASLRTRRTRQIVLSADADPFRPPVVDWLQLVRWSKSLIPY